MHREIHVIFGFPWLPQSIMTTILSILFAIAAYLIGSIPFAIVVSKMFGLEDPRTYGSKNPGATNVLRTGSKKAAILTLLGDAAKGWVVVFPIQMFGADYGFSGATVALVALAAFFGHLWPIYTGFKGGKGVATAFGVLLGLSPWLGIAVLATWLVVAYAFRYSSLAAITAALFAPLFCILLFSMDVRVLAVLVISALLVMRHGQNIANLAHGKESKIGGSKSQG
jgi:acyl phosphate:glycerol-3-phosphate acyltransferase